MVMVRRRGFSSRVLRDPSILDHPRNGFCYAIVERDSPYIKLGHSNSHPELRRRDLQTGNWRQLQLLAYTAHITEAQAHTRFGRWRVSGEWFMLTPELLCEIERFDWIDTALHSQLKASMTNAVRL
jgi:hypothetical protein